LFALWGARYETGADTGCDQARRQGLDCLFQRGSWRSLATLNLPAILSLKNDEGKDFQVVLSGYRGRFAEVMLGEEKSEVSLVDLSAYWDGDFLLLWRPLSVGGEDLKPGYRGDEVPILRAALGHIDGNTASADDPLLYDQSLAARVREFQKANRLKPDGIVGERTQIVLNLDGGDTPAPRLASGQ
jgi:general secretion pathway protein A